MRFSFPSLVAIPAAVVAVGLAIAGQVLEVPDSWYRHDTGGKDAAILEFSTAGEAVSAVLVPEGRIASIRLTEQKQAIAFRVDSVAERGEGVQVGIYRMEDQYPVEDLRPENLIERIDLQRGGSPINPRGAALYLGDATLQVRMLDSVLVTR